jgi:hypothetical protein
VSARITSAGSLILARRATQSGLADNAGEVVIAVLIHKILHTFASGTCHGGSVRIELGIITAIPVLFVSKHC